MLPVWGIALGALVLGETITPQVLIGFALVITGIALVNFRRGGLAALLGSLGRGDVELAPELADVPSEPEPR